MWCVIWGGGESVFIKQWDGSIHHSVDPRVVYSPLTTYSPIAMPHIVAVDAQGFTGRNAEFVIKELAICHSPDEGITRYHLLPPYPLSEMPFFRKKSVGYLQLRVHGLGWNDGTLDYNSGKTIIRSKIQEFKDAFFYCKGGEKAKALSNFLGVEVINVENFMDEAELQSIYFYPSEVSSDCAVHTQLDSYLKCAVKQAFMVRSLMHRLFNPQSRKLTVSYLDLTTLDGRLETYGQVKNALFMSSIVHYLAKIGYYCKGTAIHCHYCDAVSDDWQESGVVKPFNIPHFNYICHMKQ